MHRKVYNCYFYWRKQILNRSVPIQFNNDKLGWQNIFFSNFLFKYLVFRDRIFTIIVYQYNKYKYSVNEHIFLIIYIVFTYLAIRKRLIMFGEYL